jgi:hypothetical protein
VAFKWGQVRSCRVMCGQERPKGSNGLKRGEVGQVVLDMYSHFGFVHYRVGGLDGLV